jgi:hypothetical protein
MGGLGSYWNGLDSKAVVQKGAPKVGMPAVAVAQSARGGGDGSGGRGVAAGLAEELRSIRSRHSPACTGPGRRGWSAQVVEQLRQTAGTGVGQVLQHGDHQQPGVLNDSGPGGAGTQPVPPRTGLKWLQVLEAHHAVLGGRDGR